MGAIKFTKAASLFRGGGVKYATSKEEKNKTKNVTVKNVRYLIIILPGFQYHSFHRNAKLVLKTYIFLVSNYK